MDKKQEISRKQEILSKYVLPFDGDTKVPKKIKNRLAKILKEEYEIEEFSNGIKLEDREIKSVIQADTVGQINMLLKKNDIELRDTKVKKLISGGWEVSKNWEKIHDLTKEIFNIQKYVKEWLNLTSEEELELSEKQEEGVKKWIEKKKIEKRYVLVANEYKNGEYDITYLDNLLLEEKITKAEYVKILRMLQSTTPESKLNLRKFSEIITDLGVKYWKMLEIVDKVDVDLVTFILNTTEVQDIISVICDEVIFKGASIFLMNIKNDEIVLNMLKKKRKEVVKVISIMSRSNKHEFMAQYAKLFNDISCLTHTSSEIGDMLDKHHKAINSWIYLPW